MSRPWLVKRNILLMVVCVGLLTAPFGELYVVREFVALFLGFCGLFAIVAIAVFLILALEEAGRGLFNWFEACVAHFLHLDTAKASAHSLVECEHAKEWRNL
jgi:hypothetical protein